MKPIQPTFPKLRDFSQPITVRGSELAAVIAEAQAQGYQAHRMTVTDQVVYRLMFWRLDAVMGKAEGKDMVANCEASAAGQGSTAAAGGKGVKESFSKAPPSAGLVPVRPFYALGRFFKSH